MPTSKRKIARNTIANILFRISQYIISFLMLPFIVFHVGVVDYGLYLLVGAFVGYFGLLNFGVGAALEKYVAEFNAKKDEEMVIKIVNTTFLFYLGVGTIICLSVLIIGTVYVDAFNIDGDQVGKARLLAYLVAIGSLTSWPIKSFDTVLQGIQRYDIIAIVNFIRAITIAVLTVIILLNGYGIVEVVLVGILIGAISQIPIVIKAQRTLPYLTLKRKYMQMIIFKKIFKFSSVAFIGQIVSLIVMGTDRIVIGAFVGVGAITYYAVARKLHDLVSTSSSLTTSALLPAFTEFEAKEKWIAKKVLFLRSGKFRAATILLVTTPLFVLTPQIIETWMGSEFLSMVTPARIFLIYWFFRINTGSLIVTLYASEKYRILIYYYIVEAVLNLILSLILVQWFGITGVIIGTVVPHLLIIPFIIRIGLKGVNVTVKEHFLNIAFRTYPACIITFVFLFSISILWTPGSLLWVGLNVLLGMGVFAVIFYYIGLLDSESKEIRGYLKRMLSRG